MTIVKWLTDPIKVATRKEGGVKRGYQRVVDTMILSCEYDVQDRWKILLNNSLSICNWFTNHPKNLIPLAVPTVGKA